MEHLRSSHMLPRLGLSISIAVVACFATACSSGTGAVANAGGSSPTSPNSQSAPATGTTSIRPSDGRLGCDLLPPSEVSKALGVPAEISSAANQDVLGGKAKYKCYYSNSQSGEFLHLVGDNERNFDPSEFCPGSSTSEISGHEIRIDQPSGTVCVRFKGETIVVIGGNGRGMKAKPFSSEQYHALAQAIAERW